MKYGGSVAEQLERWACNPVGGIAGGSRYPRLETKGAFHLSELAS